MGMRSAINQNCKDCIYDPLSGLGTWREQVAQCPMTWCPFWEYRPGPQNGPYQRPGVDKAILNGTLTPKNADE